MTDNIIIKLIKLKDKLNINILKIRITKIQIEELKRMLNKLEIKDKKWKGVQPTDMLVPKWKGKNNLYYYGGIEIEVK